MKNSQSDVGQLAQPRIIKNYGRVSWRGLAAMLSKTRRDIKSRVAGSVRTSVKVHRIREVSASFDSIVPNDVSTVKRVCCGQSRGFETIGAGDGVGPAKN